jgi:ABC-type branched-subunit amino acid transport system ATPase component
VVRERQRPPEEHAAGAAGPAGRPPPSLLELRGASKRFGGVKAVDACSFAVAAGSITGLIGPNGSGKTTIFNLVSGTLRPDGGEIWFDGRRLDHSRPWERAWLGLGRTFQATRLLKRMTVMENVVAPLRRFSWQQLSAGAISGPEAKQALELLNFVGMEAHADEEAGHLSFGQQKLVELAQVLMLEPKLVLLDEPAGGVNPRLVDRITELVTELNREGVTFLIVEHNMPLVLSLCDPVVVLARGRGIASGPPAQIQADPLVLDAYLGEGWGDGHGQAPGASQRVEV